MLTTEELGIELLCELFCSERVFVASLDGWCLLQRGGAHCHPFNGTSLILNEDIASAYSYCVRDSRTMLDTSCSNLTTNMWNHSKFDHHGWHQGLCGTYWNYLFVKLHENPEYIYKKWGSWKWTSSTTRKSWSEAKRKSFPRRSTPSVA